MILIFSNKADTSTDLVISWLKKFNVPFLRLNEDFYDSLEIDFSENNISFHGISQKEISVIWFRKTPAIFDDSEMHNISKKINNNVNIFIEKESKTIREYIFKTLRESSHIKWLTSPFSLTQNKLMQMQVAKKEGLEIPPSFIVNSKEQLKSILEKEGELITKPMENCVNIFFKERAIGMKTTLINNLNNIPDSFAPALVQKRINKKYEIRTFYILGKFFSTKIVEKDFNEVDHRLSLIDFSSRYEIYNLPKEIENKIKNVLSVFSLNCSSIDLIVDENGNYIFLEINPTGQFTYHSFFNNTYLEKEIALALKTMYNE
ncbi:hypothetical protein A0O34_05925 [Chryseobacterium glaciei]|uniref:ATP-grasp domain-containing protein n=1 Tax=Chryseobacterium glaciei TaxID=1685010 RepID=A0A172XTB4_9FLAO|nr:hypothetical protein [Chryseobacterium glaciei]ANF50075.1 hypothetical protein A0O34_05925 [Chryseobacterium glaciei]